MGVVNDKRGETVGDDVGRILEGLSLVPTGALFEVARVLIDSEPKHPNEHYRTVEPGDHVAALHRHVRRWIYGEPIDEDSGLHALAHAAARALFALQLELEARARMAGVREHGAPVADPLAVQCGSFLPPQGDETELEALPSMPGDQATVVVRDDER